ncbi:MAG: hypothetical protein CR997_10655 [Acidobacteria bacterium]|nr:MAG: hypothetical protein CR997_10655 [Acidobacteriota bacterium]
MESKQYTCNQCECSVDQPVDNCPVCHSVFYWLLKTKREVSPQERDLYAAAMRASFGPKTGNDFIFHGGRIWLPHSFWQKNSTRELLNQFDWIEDIVLIQYKKSSTKKKREDGVLLQESLLFDSNAKRTVVNSQDLSETQKNQTRSRSFGLRPILGPLSVGLFLVFIAAAYFVLMVGKQRNLMHNREHNGTPQIMEESEP